MKIKGFFLHFLLVPVRGRASRRRTVPALPAATPWCLGRGVWVRAGRHMLPDDVLDWRHLRAWGRIKRILSVADQIRQRYPVSRSLRAFFNRLWFLYLRFRCSSVTGRRTSFVRRRLHQPWHTIGVRVFMFFAPIDQFRLVFRGSAVGNSFAFLEAKRVQFRS